MSTSQSAYFSIDAADDRQIARALLTYDNSSNFMSKLYKDITERQWCAIFIDEMINIAQIRLMFDLMQNRATRKILPMT